jgi:hypothetical protein
MKKLCLSALKKCWPFIFTLLNVMNMAFFVYLFILFITAGMFIPASVFGLIVYIYMHIIGAPSKND